MRKFTIRKALALALCLACFGNSFICVRAASGISAENIQVYYEAPAFSVPHSSSKELENDSWATFFSNDSLTNANIQLHLNNYTYSFDVQGVAEPIGNGYVGVYQGYLVPDENDTELHALLPANESEVLVSANVVFCNDDVFFTLVIGVITDTQDPIVKAYGISTDAINAVAQLHADDLAYSYSAQQLESETHPFNSYRASVDATTKYQTRAVVYDSSSRALGEASLFHANQLRNQGSMSVYAKVNSNTKNANTYARGYFGLTSNDISVVYPLKVELGLSSNDNAMHVDGTNYNPKDEVKTITILIPYYYGGSFGTVRANTKISSIRATTSGVSPHNNQNVKWVTTHSIGMSGTNGDYTTQSGLPAFASYKYEGQVTTTKTAKLTATFYITYNVIVEDARYGTITGYTFTTATKSCTSSVSILP